MDIKTRQPIQGVIPLERLRSLWQQVLIQALEDKEWSWFKSDSQEVGSFLWVCTVLDFTPDRWRKIITQPCVHHFRYLRLREYD